MTIKHSLTRPFIAIYFLAALGLGLFGCKSSNHSRTLDTTTGDFRVDETSTEMTCDVEFLAPRPNGVTGITYKLNFVNGNPNLTVRADGQHAIEGFSDRVLQTNTPLTDQESAGIMAACSDYREGGTSFKIYSNHFIEVLPFNAEPKLYVLDGNGRAVFKTFMESNNLLELDAFSGTLGDYMSCAKIGANRKGFNLLHMKDVETGMAFLQMQRVDPAAMLAAATVQLYPTDPINDRVDRLPLVSCSDIAVSSPALNATILVTKDATVQIFTETQDLIYKLSPVGLQNIKAYAENFQLQESE